MDSSQDKKLHNDVFWWLAWLLILTIEIVLHAASIQATYNLVTTVTTVCNASRGHHDAILMQMRREWVRQHMNATSYSNSSINIPSSTPPPAYTTSFSPTVPEGATTDDASPGSGQGSKIYNPYSFDDEDEIEGRDLRHHVEEVYNDQSPEVDPDGQTSSHPPPNHLHAAHTQRRSERIM